ncbi:ATP-binding protein [Pedobacter miscanthi]|uniref:AlbA family DNA-binding domain-containing protein n=1 Tax=Pedobacter miscanthi TaxID=2259170 RepID=UPI00292CDE19|nr:ATP-binding protein [Pedobacter miscanthi]
MSDITEKLTQLISYESENSLLDFKQIQYPMGKTAANKAELLKDISSMANGPSNEDKFIIIGVKEKAGRANGLLSVEELTDEAIYQQFVLQNIEPKINFEYRSFAYQGKHLAYFRIFDNEQRPYLFKKDVPGISPKAQDFHIGDGFIRLGSSTKRLDRNDLELIYKTRFSKIDKKRFISVEPYLAKSQQNELKGALFLDFRVSNRSSAQIHLDVELKLDNAGAGVMIADELIDKLFNKERERKRQSSMFGFTDLPRVYVPNQHITLKQDEDFITVKRDRKRNIAGALTIAQHDTDNEIFLNDLIVIGRDTDRLKGTLTLRSDDFSGSPFILNLDIPITLT